MWDRWGAGQRVLPPFGAFRSLWSCAPKIQISSLCAPLRSSRPTDNPGKCGLAPHSPLPQGLYPLGIGWLGRGIRALKYCAWQRKQAFMYRDPFSSGSGVINCSWELPYHTHQGSEGHELNKLLQTMTWFAFPCLLCRKGLVLFALWPGPCGNLF